MLQKIQNSLHVDTLVSMCVCVWGGISRVGDIELHACINSEMLDEAEEPNSRLEKIMRRFF